MKVKLLMMKCMFSIVIILAFVHAQETKVDSTDKTSAVTTTETKTTSTD